jgi:hypothetical protein
MHALDIADGSYLGDGQDFLGVGLDPSLGDDKTEELHLWNPQHALLQVQLDVYSPESGEHLL